ncbi:unnamed protein product [Dovyalis caffra]|uniref:Uncharacterized protein n=1 Tax=Dovyalis caffra TaxID=77055 RepID=A0AAV1QQ40_9ROSI|nr:unnamed protein product [Dovyalis caffra]
MRLAYDGQSSFVKILASKGVFFKGVKPGRGRNSQLYALFPFKAIYQDKIRPMLHETDVNKILNYWWETEDRVVDGISPKQLQMRTRDKGIPFGLSEKMTIEEAAAGPAGPKVLRLLYFVGAGFICTVGINKWRELERKSILKQQQQQQKNNDLLP